MKKIQRKRLELVEAAYEHALEQFARMKLDFDRLASRHGGRTDQISKMRSGAFLFISSKIFNL
jgi:hypothetical protein